MDPDFLIPICALGVMLIISVTAILSSTISKHKLKVEQIKADAMVRAEEVRSRNQLELERLVRAEQANSAGRSEYSASRSAASDEELQTYHEESRQRSRIRD
ncbi:MAG TPA: hypothetical protein VIM13_07690 [Clostridia bacterium]